MPERTQRGSNGIPMPNLASRPIDLSRSAGLVPGVHLSMTTWEAPGPPQSRPMAFDRTPPNLHDVGVNVPDHRPGPQFSAGGGEKRKERERPEPPKVEDKKKASHVGEAEYQRTVQPAVGPSGQRALGPGRPGEPPQPLALPAGRPPQPILPGGAAKALAGAVGHGSLQQFGPTAARLMGFGGED